MRPIKKRRPPPLALDLRRDALGQEPLYDPTQEKERMLKRREKAAHPRPIRRAPGEIKEARRRLKRAV